jgi:hypothetical protein
MKSARKIMKLISTQGSLKFIAECWVDLFSVRLSHNKLQSNMSALLYAIVALLLVVCAHAGVVEESGLDLDMHIHTTGPNCWATGEMEIKYITTIPGAPSPPEALAMTVDQISSHIGLPKFVNMSETGTVLFEWHI